MTSVGRIIEPASSGDAATVTSLWESCGLTRPWNDPLADFTMAIDGVASTILVMRDDGAIIGSIMVGFDGHRGWVYYLAVATDRQRGGIGRALMAAAEHWLGERRAPKMQLMVRADNMAALGFYRALGLDVQDVVTLGRFLGEAM